MPIPPQHQGRSIYHFTHIDNLLGILRNGFHSPNEQRRLGLEHRSIALQGIQRRRATMPVTCGLGGVVHDYVPFYFCKRSSMLLAVINAKNADQHELIHFALPIRVLDEPAIVFTDAAANTDIPPNFFFDTDDLVRLDWASVDSLKYSLPTAQKQARMAEALIYRSCNIAAFDHIIAWNDHMAARVREIYGEVGITPPRIFTDPHFHFTKYPEDETKSLVTGPKAIRWEYQKTIEYVENRGKHREPDLGIWKSCAKHCVAILTACKRLVNSLD